MVQGPLHKRQRLWNFEEALVDKDQRQNLAISQNCSLFFVLLKGYAGLSYMLVSSWWSWRVFRRMFIVPFLKSSEGYLERQKMLAVLLSSIELLPTESERGALQCWNGMSPIYVSKVKVQGDGGFSDSFSVALLETSARVSLHAFVAKYIKIYTNSQKLRRFRKSKHKDSGFVYAGKVAKVEDQCTRHDSWSERGYELERVRWNLFELLGPLVKLREAALS